MAQVDYIVRLDLNKDIEQGAQHVKQGDTNTRVLRFHIHAGGETYDISDKNCVLHFLKPDGSAGSIRCFHAREKGTCYCGVSSQMTAVAGEVKCDLKIYSGDTLLHTPKFCLLVATDALSGDTSADTFGDEKADKVEDPVAGHFAGLDAEGNLTDSGSEAADFAAASHSHAQSDVTGLAEALAAKMDKVQDAYAGEIPVMDSNGQIVYHDPAIMADDVQLLAAQGAHLYVLVYFGAESAMPSAEGYYSGGWAYASDTHKLYTVEGTPVVWADASSRLNSKGLYLHNSHLYYYNGAELAQIS